MDCSLMGTNEGVEGGWDSGGDWGGVDGVLWYLVQTIICFETFCVLSNKNDEECV